jgi:tetratricopeptide (TPR) repeat protein
MLGIALGALPSARAGAWGRSGALRPAVAVVAVAAIIPQFVVLVAGTHLSNSHAAFNSGDATEARSQALSAKAIEPWAASPYLQLGQVAEAEGNYVEASQWLDKAISHSRRDWMLWLIAAQIQTQYATHSSGAQARKAIVRARRYADEARRLNPGSSLFKAVS